MKRNELAQLLEITPVQLDALLNHFPQVTDLDDVPDHIAQQLLNKLENSRALSGEAPKSEGGIMQMIDNIDIARRSNDINRENTQGQHDYLIEESLLQAEIEGELAGELEAITFLDSYNKGRSSVLTQYTSYKESNHQRFLNSILSKYGDITSQESEKNVQDTMKYKKEVDDIRGKIRSKKR